MNSFRPAPAFWLWLLLAAAVNAHSAEVREREPEPEKADGKVYEWHSSDGLGYQYCLPRNYDAEKGANLTFILHGSNLTRTWGFANHKAGEFRPDDIVVSPDGTTPNGQGGFNSLGKPEDALRFHALHRELTEKFKVNACFLYGHSQGSFFALYYAGEYPDAVQGIVAHASGVWNWTKRPPGAHHQAIVFMHGTADPVVPFFQSKGGLSAYRESGYEKVRLRPLEGWNHWPAEHNGPIRHTSQQLAWVEGMTTHDITRLGWCFGMLNKLDEKSLHDFAGLYLLAERIASMESAPDNAKVAAERAMQNVELLAEQQIAEMKAPATPEQAAFGSEAWIGHLQVFLRSFEGVPAADQLAATWKGTLDEQRSAVNGPFADYRKAVQAGSRAEAFRAGIDAIRSGYLLDSCADLGFLNNLTAWAEDGSLEIPKETRKEGEVVLESFQRSLRDGAETFQSVNKKARW